MAVTLHEELAEQLHDELLGHVHALTAVLSDPLILAQLTASVEDAAPYLAAQLISGDDKLAAQTVIDLANVLGWDDSDPHWWTTPLGQAIARSVGHPTAETVSYSVAGAMLGGVSKQAVHKQVAAGRLDRGPDSGVTTLSIRQLLRDRHA